LQLVKLFSKSACENLDAISQGWGAQRGISLTGRKK